MNYLIGDFLIRLKNAYMARKKSTTFTYSKVVFSIGKLLQEEGYIQNIVEKKEGNKKSLQIELLYKNKKPTLSDVKIISKPSAHIYVGKDNVNKKRKGYSTTILSTNKGIMTAEKAKEKGVGGELIARLS